jgi:hypothetical protein
MYGLDEMVEYGADSVIKLGRIIARKTTFNALSML